MGVRKKRERTNGCKERERESKKKEIERERERASKKKEIEREREQSTLRPLDQKNLINHSKTTNNVSIHELHSPSINIL